MSAWQRWLLVVWLVAIVPRASGHETDQFAVPDNRQFADLGDYFNRWAYHAISHGVDQANARIGAAIARHAPATVIADLQSASRVTMAVREQWPWSVTQIETFEKVLRSAEIRRRYPGRVVAYGDRFGGVYQFAFFPLDVRQFAHILFFSSTIKVFGTYMGTDKFGHFTDEGITYYYAYRKARDAGEDEPHAVAAAVHIGTHGLMSERGMLGLLANADYSNADISANFAGFLFYRNLTETVRIKGELNRPMLVREGPFWRLRAEIRADSGFFAAFISDHLDEALNPGYFDPYLRPAMHDAVRARTTILLRHYAGAKDEPRNRRWFDDKLRELSTYWGVDYGHLGKYDELVSIGNSCFGASAPAQTAYQLASARLPSESVLSYPVHHAADVHMHPLGTGRTRDSFGYTSLHDASRLGEIGTIRQLVDAGADVGAKDDGGTTSLHLACRHGKLEAARLLLQSGADVNAVSDAGITPLHEAALAGDTQIVRLLLTHGARINARDLRGRTPSDVAAENHFEDVEKLLKHFRGGGQ